MSWTGRESQVPRPAAPAAAPSYVRLRGLPFQVTEHEVAQWLIERVPTDPIDVRGVHFVWRDCEAVSAPQLYPNFRGLPPTPALPPFPQFVELRDSTLAERAVRQLHRAYMNVLQKNRYIEVFMSSEAEARREQEPAREQELAREQEPTAHRRRPSSHPCLLAAGHTPPAAWPSRQASGRPGA